MDAIPEVHLIIVWAAAIGHLDLVLGEIKARLSIKAVYEVDWGRDRFTDNLTRFYGQNLSAESDKAKHIGTAAFTAFVVVDEAPRYGLRQTAKGNVIVNVNMFDFKAQLRKLTGGGHRIHATNDSAEAQRDIWLLLQKNVSSFLASSAWDSEIINVNSQLVGAEGWVSLSELFLTLNVCCKYVVLRNFDMLPDRHKVGSHGDLDLLVDNLNNAVRTALAVKAIPGEKRVFYNVQVGGHTVPVDFRYVGDDYYDRRFEEQILEHRTLCKGTFYTPCTTDHFYSLLYHALLHKARFSDDYRGKLVELATEIGLNFDGFKPEGASILRRYFQEQGFGFTKPIDKSVGFNNELFLSMRSSPNEDVVATSTLEMENRCLKLLLGEAMLKQRFLEKEIIRMRHIAGTKSK